MNVQIPRGSGVKVGVYQITSSESDKIYIGGSYHDFSTRACQHKRELNKNQHHCKHLQRAYNKYGAENFTFSIVEEHDKKQFNSKEELRQFIISREQFYLDNYPRNIKYNTVEIAYSTLGFKHTEEFKKRKSEQYKGRKQHPNTYKAVMEANIGRKHTPEALKKMSEFQKGRKKSKEEIAKRVALVTGTSFKNKRKLILCTPDYEIIKFYKDSEEASGELKLSSSFIRTKAANCGGTNQWLIMYEWYPIVNKRSQYKKVEEFNKETGEIIKIWNSGKELGEHYNLSPARIKHRLLGAIKPIPELKNDIRYAN